MNRFANIGDYMKKIPFSEFEFYGSGVKRWYYVNFKNNA